MSLNGGDGVLLSVYKSSTASTNQVSAACREAVAELSEEFPSLDLRVVSDQGKLIDMFISSIVNSLLLGGCSPWWCWRCFCATGSHGARGRLHSVLGAAGAAACSRAAVDGAAAGDLQHRRWWNPIC